MAYIGRAPLTGNYSKLDDIGPSFNGVTTSFALTVSGSSVVPSQAVQLLISVGGVIQEPETAYTVSGSNITFTEAPSTSADFFGIVLGDTLDIGVPSDNTVSAGKLQIDAVTTSKINASAVTTVKIADGNITGAKLNVESVVASNVAFTHRSTAYSNQHYYTTTNVSASGNTFTWNLNDPVAEITLNADNFVYTINAPTNMQNGGTYLLMIKLGASAGTGTALSWNGNTAPWAFPANTYPTITANTGAVDVVSFVSDGTYMYGNAAQNYGKN